MSEGNIHINFESWQQSRQKKLFPSHPLPRKEMLEREFDGDKLHIRCRIVSKINRRRCPKHDQLGGWIIPSDARQKCLGSCNLPASAH